MIYSRMLAEIENHVTHLFSTQETDKHHFHNIANTRQVVKHAEELAAQVRLSEEDYFALMAAAWFQYTGWLFTDLKAQVEKSVSIMRSFFTTHRLEPHGLIEKIERLIRFTAFTRAPDNTLEEILHDADTFYFGTDDFRKFHKCLRRELQENGNSKDPNWKQNTLAFLRQHNYFTPYCRLRLERKKTENIKELMIKTDVTASPSLLEEDKKQQAAQIKGIQTLMRVMNDNHIEFSTIADNKANLLISVNAVMISVVLSVMVRRLESDSKLLFPTILFLAVSVTTIVLSILSTRPKVSSGYFTRDDVLNKRINLMFFGNFYKTKVEDYEWGMRKLMNDPDYMYGTMIRDMHQLGKVLAKKYKLIGAAYMVFMYGIIATIIAFVVAILLAPQTTGTPTAY